MPERRERQDERWEGRPKAALAIRVFAFVAPILTSIAATAIASRILPQPRSFAGLVAHWVLLCAFATGVLYVAERLARRLLPLSALLALSLIFPDRAPSRFKTAIRTNTARQLERTIAVAREAGLADDTTEAADQLLELVAALSHHDRLTRGHSERVRAYTRMIAEEMGLDEDAVNKLHWAGLAHDVGKLFVSYEILNKPGRLTDEEFDEIRGHAAAGAELVEPLRPWLGEWLDAVGEHHEKWDGTGYPNRLAGTDISLAGRIVAVADVFDVITSVRSYKQPESPADARAELRRCAGSHFDPEVVRAFLNVSVGKLRLVMGPLSWLAQSQFLSNIPIGPSLGAAASGVAATVGVALGAGYELPTPKPQPVVEVAVAPSTTVAVPVTPPVERPRSGPTPTFPEPIPLRAAVPVSDHSIGVEDSALIIDPLANDPSDARLVSVSQPAHGTVTVLPDGRVRFTPQPDWSGTTEFVYVVEGPDGVARDAKVVVTIESVNDAPVAVADLVTLLEDSEPVLVDVRANDVDVDGDTLIASLPTPTVSTALGILATDPTGHLRFTPSPNAHGDAAVPYLVSDTHGITDQALLTIRVTPVNDPPVASDELVSIDEDGSTGAVAVLANDTDIDGDDLVLASAESPNGVVAVDGTSLTYTPAPDTNGRHVVSYVVGDRQGGTANGTLVVNVAAVNDDPSFAGGDAVSVAEDSGARTIGAWATAISSGPVDESDQVLDFHVSVSDPSLFAGPVRVDPSTGDLVFTPAPDGFGVATVTTTLHDDAGGESAPHTTTIEVRPVNDPPNFQPGGPVTADEDSGPRTVAAWASEISAGPANEAAQTLTFRITAADPSLFTGPIDVDEATGDLRFTPAPDAFGSTTLTIDLRDGGAASAPAVVPVTIAAVNDDPTIAVGADHTSPEDSGAQTVAAWATGITPGPTNESAQTVGVSVTAADPSLFTAAPSIDPASGDLTYTPAPDAFGTTALTITADDGVGGSTVVGGNLTIEAVNDLPSFAVGADQSVTEDDPTVTVVGWASGIDRGAVNESGQAVSFTVTPDDPSLFAGAVSVSPSGDLSYTPAPDANGTTTVTISIADDAGGSSPDQTFDIDISAVDDAPLAIGESYLMDQSTTLTVAAPGLLVNDSDADDDPLTVVTTPVTPPGNGVLNLSTDGSFTYTPNPAFSGTVTFDYAVSDGAAPDDVATVEIFVDSTIANGTYHLGTSGASASTWSLVSTPPTGTGPEPDHDGDGKPGLTVAKSNQSLGETDPTEFQHWTLPTSVPMALRGPISLSLWSTADDFDDDADVDYSAWVHDCATDGTGCVLVASTVDVHIDEWNRNVSGWVRKTLPVGTADHTIAAGRMLRLRLMFNHEDVWVAASGDRPSAIILSEVNATPEAVADAAAVAESSTGNVIPVVDNDLDANLDPTTVAVFGAGPTLGTATPLGDGTIDYTPIPTAHGTDTFDYQVCDLDGLCDTATVTITIDPLVGVPGANPDFFVAVAPTPEVLDVLANDVDADGIDVATVIVTVAPTQGGTAVDVGTGLITYTPDPGATGVDSFDYQWTDTLGNPSTTTVTVRID